MPDVYDNLLDVLSRYLSAIHARSILTRNMRAAGVGGRQIPEQNIPDLVQRLRRSASLFLSREASAALQRDLDGMWQRDKVEAETLPVESEQDIVRVRSRARELSALLGARRITAQKIATVVSELARNIVLYTPGGQIELIPTQNPRGVHIRATDRGSGISNLDEILEGRYDSRTGLGRGLLGSKRVADSFDIDSGGKGTRVEVGIHL